jgi:hypothetical protein
MEQIAREEYLPVIALEIFSLPLFIEWVWRINPRVTFSVMD